MRNLIIAFSAISVVILFFITYPFLALIYTVNPKLLAQTLWIPEAINALILALKAATLSTIILILLGVPLAYILVHTSFPGKGLIEAIIDLPLIIPHAVVGILLLISFGPKTPIGYILSHIGIILEDSFWAIVAVFMFVSAPLLVDCAKDGFASIDPALEGVARSLGAGPFYTFFRISLPLAVRSILTGALLAWARAMSEVGALLIIAYWPKTINILVIEWFNQYGLGYAVALTAILLPISVTVFAILRTILRWKG